MAALRAPDRAFRGRPGRLGRATSAVASMIWNALVARAAHEIRRNALRSFLTMLGIVIGVAAVIMMVTLGGGATAKVTRHIASLGSNMLFVMPGQRPGPGAAPGAAVPRSRTRRRIERERRRRVAAVAPSAQQSATVVFGNENWIDQRHRHRPGLLSRAAAGRSPPAGPSPRASCARASAVCDPRAKPSARSCSARRTRWAQRSASATCPARHRRARAEGPVRHGQDQDDTS